MNIQTYWPQLKVTTTNSLIKQAADCSFHSRCFTSIYFLLSAALNYRWNKLEAQLRCIVSKFTLTPVFLSTHRSVLMRQPGTSFNETIHLYIKNNASINGRLDNNTAERIYPSINPFRNLDCDQQNQMFLLFCSMQWHQMKLILISSRKLW